MGEESGGFVNEKGRVRRRTRPVVKLPSAKPIEPDQRFARFSGATVMRTVSPELPGKPVNIASTRLGTR